MNKKMRNIGIVVLLGIWVALTVFLWFSAPKTLSVAERRPLQQMPEFSLENLINGSFMGKFEDYSLDQFPLRDQFRTLKSLFSYNVLQQQDNNGIYLQDGYAGKLEYPLNAASVSYALKRFAYIYEQYLKGTESKIYLCIVPDKGYYLAEANGYPAMDYEKLFADMYAGMPWAQPVDITKTLTITDYYRTDTHWRQEKLLKAAQTLCNTMDVTSPKEEDFTQTLLTQKFYGVYYGQAALPMASEPLYILENRLFSACRVYNHEKGEYGQIYNMEKLAGLDPYDVYLSGAQALLTIENPNAPTEKELVVFRDSFGSSLTPLLVQAYKTITLVDTRYIHPDLLGQYITFDTQDVLFLYSTLILNNSASLK